MRFNRKPPWILGFCFLVVAQFFCSLVVAADLKVGDKAPVWQVEDINGKKVLFPEDAGNKRAVLVFWASWCPYCKSLMPVLAKIHGDVDASLPVYSINFASEDSPSENPISRYEFTTIWKGDDLATMYQVETVPTLYIVQDNKIVYHLGNPPASHPSNDKKLSRSRQIDLLSAWWEEQLRTQLKRHVPLTDSEIH